MNSVEQIKDKLNIVDIIGSYIKVEKAGINYKAKCPFHNEKTPSFFVSASRQSFYCFGCGEKGDMFTFVEKYEGIDFKETLSLLADKAGIELPKYTEDSNSNETRNTKEKLYEIMERSCDIFEKNLEKDSKANAYLQKRGLTKNMIKKWRLGLAKDEWRDLFDTLISKGFTKENLLLAGVIKEKSPKYYDTFRDRIIFPIFDAGNKVIAFSGRIVTEKAGAPKYLNSPETPIFHKSNVLYGWHIAKEAIRKLDYAVLVEGQMDLLMSHLAQVPNTVASSGTALTSDHLQKIKKLTNRIIIGYDSDKAGQKAAERAGELALSLNMEVKIAEMPENEDPASMVLKDPQHWKKCLREARHLIDFALSKIPKDKKGVAFMKKVEETILPYFKYIKSEIERSHYVHMIANKLGVNEEAVLKEITVFNKQQVGSEQKNIRTEISSPEKILAGMVFAKKDKDILNKWQELCGEKEVMDLLKTFEGEKEALIFQAEIWGGDSGEILERIELKILKDKLRQKTREMDDPNKDKKENMKKEVERISKKIDQLLNKNIK
ncbi:MAG: DNA primase [Patescibacteria group bacterium]